MVNFSDLPVMETQLRFAPHAASTLLDGRSGNSHIKGDARPLGLRVRSLPGLPRAGAPNIASRRMRRW